MKICAYCGKELTSSQRNNTYCSNECAIQGKQEKVIQSWKCGEFSGTGERGKLSVTIRNYLLQKANFACEECGWSKVNPTTNLVPLEIHHIDGDYLNNKEENLKVLCPSCHALTSNFKALNSTTREREQTRKNKCVDCGKDITYGATRCKSCQAKLRYSDKMVTRDELKDLIRSTPFTKIGDMFGVTDNAIRKWCISYNLPSKKKDIAQYSDEEWSQL